MALHKFVQSVRCVRSLSLNRFALQESLEVLGEGLGAAVTLGRGLLQRLLQERLDVAFE
jgi:hypothetical protein